MRMHLAHRVRAAELNMLKKVLLEGSVETTV